MTKPVKQINGNSFRNSPEEMMIGILKDISANDTIMPIIKIRFMIKGFVIISNKHQTSYYSISAFTKNPPKITTKSLKKQ